MENTLKLLNETVEHCDFLTTCHYVEAEDNKSRRIRYGLPSLFINLVVGSVLVADLGKAVPDAMKWIGAILALLSSFLVGIQTFYGFEKSERGHRQMGNRFNRISRALAILKAAFLDKTVNDQDLSKRFDSVMKEYEEVCKENEETPPSREIAKKLQKQLEDESSKQAKAAARLAKPDTAGGATKPK